MAASELRPDLRLISPDRVRYHEHPERRRTLGLTERIEREGKLRNPPVVADMSDGHFLLLDGANRVSAFRELGYSHVAVQVVDYGDPSVQLKGWHHLLLEGRCLDLRRAYQRIPGVRLAPVARAEIGHLLELRQVYAILVEDEGSHWGVYPTAPPHEVDAHPRVEVLEALVGAYEGQTRLERIKLADFEQLPDAIQSVEHQLCLFPVIRKEELLHLAAEGVMIPTGLTRHVIPGRALGINLDLGFLREGTGEEEKLRRFREHVDRLAVGGRIRFYEESVFLMNE